MTLSLEPSPRGRERLRLRAGEAIASRYRLERFVGQGAMGPVWLAADERLQRPVAIRLTDETAGSRLQRFTDAARSAAALWHPNLVQIFDFGINQGHAFLVMEYLAGGTLLERLEAGKFGAESLRRLACDLLAALAYLHSRGQRHGAVEAPGVHLDGEGCAHLSGFGMAAGSPRDDLRALGRLLAEAASPGGADPSLDGLIDGLGRSASEIRFATADQALEALRVCPDPAGQVTQEFDVLAALAEPGGGVEPVIERSRRYSRWMPQRVLTAVGLYAASQRQAVGPYVAS